MNPIKNLSSIIVAAFVIFAISACGGSSSGGGSKATGIKVTTIAGGGTSTDATESNSLKLKLTDLESLVVKGPGELLISKNEGYTGLVQSFNVSQGTINALAFTGLQVGVTATAPGVQIVGFYDDTYYMTSTKGEYKLYTAPVATKAATWIAGGAASGNTDGAGQSATFTSMGRTARVGDLLYFVQSSTSNLYQLIRSVDLKAPYNVKTIAGGRVGHLDGSAAVASFKYPMDIVLIDADKKLLVVDSVNDLIRQIDLDSTDSTGAKPFNVTTFAGRRDPVTNVPIEGALDATSATMASFYFPQSIAKAPSGNLYIADTANRLIRKIEFKDATYGAVSTIAGTGLEEVKDNAPDSAGHYNGLRASFSSLTSLVFDGDLLYLIDGNGLNRSIRKIEFLDGAP